MRKILVALALVGAASQVHAASPQEIYNKHCVACHATGVAGAPKKGDKAAWEPRLKQGEAVLLTHINKGFKAMPPKGLCMDCTDADYKALIKFMSN